MKQLVALIFFACIAFVVKAQPYDKIFRAFEKGDVETIAQHFDEHVDIAILQTEGIYSKAQAKIILKNFFSANTPSTFRTQHQGGSEQSKYIIGNLKTSKNSYRVYFLFKKDNQQYIIQKIKIEND